MAREETVSITSAAESHSAELAGRQRRYLISMGIRTACFIGFIAVPGPARWVLLVGAVFLPYVAVILANAGVRRPSTTAEFVRPEPAGELTDGHDGR